MARIIAKCLVFACQAQQHEKGIKRSQIAQSYCVILIGAKMKETSIRYRLELTEQDLANLRRALLEQVMNACDCWWLRSE